VIHLVGLISYYVYYYWDLLSHVRLYEDFHNNGVIIFKMYRDVVWSQLQAS